MTALQYFLDNIAKYQDYDPAQVGDIAFVPAVLPDGKETLGTPAQVFTGPEAALFGFLVARPSIRNDARDKLKLKQHPPTSNVLSVLEKSPPQDPSVARQWFEALAGRLTGEHLTHVVRLWTHTCFYRVFSGTTEEISGASHCTCRTARRSRQRD